MYGAGWINCLVGKFDRAMPTAAARQLVIFHHKYTLSLSLSLSLTPLHNNSGDREKTVKERDFRLKKTPERDGIHKR